MGKPRVSGAFRSRPVSRILSRMTIRLCGLPGSSAGRLSGACSPCTGRGLASRRVATTLVGSYPTVSPLPSASLEICRRRSPFCATFRRLSPPGSPQRPALRCPDFPRATRARGHPACTESVAAAGRFGSCETRPPPHRRRSHEAASCARRLPRRRRGRGGCRVRGPRSRARREASRRRQGRVRDRARHHRRRHEQRRPGDRLRRRHPHLHERRLRQVELAQGRQRPGLLRPHGRRRVVGVRLDDLAPRGQITVEGPFYDTHDSVLAITGGTGAYANARGSMELRSRAGGTEFAFLVPHSGQNDPAVRQLQHELAAHQALHARAAQERVQLLLERAVERGDRLTASGRPPSRRPAPGRGRRRSARARRSRAAGGRGRSRGRTA